MIIGCKCCHGLFTTTEPIDYCLLCGDEEQNIFLVNRNDGAVDTAFKLFGDVVTSPPYPDWRDLSTWYAVYFCPTYKGLSQVYASINTVDKCLLCDGEVFKLHFDNQVDTLIERYFYFVDRFEFRNTLPNR